MNSLFGRFSLNCNLGVTGFTDKGDELIDLYQDETIKMGKVYFLNDDERALYRYSFLDDFVKEHSKYNIMLSLWTTALGRLKLLEAFEQIDENGGQVLYSGKYF